MVMVVVVAAVLEERPLETITVDQEFQFLLQVLQ
jgi:hypothetical protein